MCGQFSFNLQLVKLCEFDVLAANCIPFLLVLESLDEAPVASSYQILDVPHLPYHELDDLLLG